MVLEQQNLKMEKSWILIVACRIRHLDWVIEYDFAGLSFGYR